MSAVMNSCGNTAIWNATVGDGFRVMNNRLRLPLKLNPRTNGIFQSFR
jgi:hypothetical protein